MAINKDTRSFWNTYIYKKKLIKEVKTLNVKDNVDIMIMAAHLKKKTTKT